jgi:endonuclease-8
VLAGRAIAALTFAFPNLQPWERRLRGKRVASVDTVGKHMLVRFEHGVRIYSHNQLYGRWFVRDRDDYPKTRRSLRLALHTRDHSALLYSASDIEVIQAHDLDQHPRLRNLGPDPLDRGLSVRACRARAADARFAGRSLAALLLDQSFFAGLGNYLRSEILYQARLHPALRPRDCSAAQIEGLARAIRDLPRRSYKTGGITNDPARVRALRKTGVSRSAYRFHVFGRDGEPCYRCSAPIERQTLAGRRAYFCPACQSGSDV